MSDNGTLTITFNQNLTVPDFASVALNLSTNNSIDLYSFYPQNITTFEPLIDILQLIQIIQFQIICNSIIDKHYLEFEIQLLKWDSQKIEIFVNFTYPQIVSIGRNFDQLAFQVLNGSNFTSNSSNKEQLDIFYNGYFEVDIPPQRLETVEKAKQIAKIAQSSFTSVIVFQSVYQMIISQTIQPSQKLLMNLQMQTGLKYYQVTMPYQAYFYLQVVNQTVEFQMDWNSLLQSMGIHFSFDQILNIQIIEMPQLPPNLQRAGINTLNIFNNMKNILIVIFTFLLLNMIAPVFLIFSSSQQGLANYIKKQYSDIKFNGLIRSITVGLLNQANTITIILMYYRNQNWKDFKTQSKRDQIKNICLWTFIFVSLTSLPLIFFFKLHLNKDQLKDKEFIESYGVLIEKMKLRKPSTKYVYPLLLLNRLVFAFIPVALFNIPSLQIIFVILESFLYNVFVIQANVNVDWVEYYQDLFNEYSLLAMFTLLTLFGDSGLIFCLDCNISIEKKIYAQMVAGIVFTSIGILVVVFNIGLLCKKQVQTICLYYVKYQNILMKQIISKQNKKTKKIDQSQRVIQQVDLKQKEQKIIFQNKVFKQILAKADLKIDDKISSEQQQDFSQQNAKDGSKKKLSLIKNMNLSAEDKNYTINISTKSKQPQNSVEQEFQESKTDQIQVKFKYSNNSDGSEEKNMFFKEQQPQKQNPSKNQKNIHDQFMKAYHNYKKGIFKGHEEKYYESTQDQMIEKMAFKESNSIKQLHDKHKQLNRYLESIREYNYSNLNDLPVYNQNRIQFNNFIANMKDALIKNNEKSK